MIFLHFVGQSCFGKRKRTVEMSKQVLFLSKRTLWFGRRLGKLGLRVEIPPVNQGFLELIGLVVD